ncbi:hypothetical protein PFISCL1PPCAC_25496, partial [Pristionchus fissidentatus]
NMSRKKRSRPATPESSGDSGLHQKQPIDGSTVLSILSLVALATVPFLPSIDGEFIFDDRRTIVENGVVRGTKPLSEILTTDYWGDVLASKASHKSYRPLTTLTFWLNHRLHGLWTPGYHAVNIALHAINTVLVHRLATVIGRRIASGPPPDYGAWTAAAAFAVHPVHVEAAELLSALFFLATVFLYLGSEPGAVGTEPTTLGTLPRSKAYATLVVFSVASKEQGITAPIVCVALEWALSGRRISIRRAASNVVLVAILATLINYAHYWSYSLSLLIFPSSLCFDYSMGCFAPIISLADYRILTTVTLLVVSAAALVLVATVSEPMRRWILSIAVITVVPFLPASNLLVTVGFTVAERVLYLPSIGVCLALFVVVYGIQNRFPRSIDKSMMRSLGWTVLVIAAAMCAQRSSHWRSSISLFSKDLAVCPNNAKIHYNLGKVLADMGASREAEQRYREALRLHPAYESALNNLGNLLEASGRTTDAEEYLAEAIRVAPSFAAAWMNLGIAQMRAGKYNMSEASLAHSIALRPNSAEAHFNLGVLQLRQRRQSAARAAWIDATSLDPAHARAWSNLFVLLDEMERCDEVIELSHTACYHNPSLSTLRLSMGTCYAKRGDFLDAERELRRAVQLAPTSAIYHANLGVLYQRWHRYDDAVRAYSTALDLDPAIGSVRDNLETTRKRLNSTR